MLRFLPWLMSVLLFFSSLDGSFRPIITGTKQEWLMMIDHFESLFLTHYAPLKWKEDHYDWNLLEETQRARQRIFSLNDCSLDNVKPILNTLFRSTRDSHVGISYDDDRFVYLGFNVIYHENNFYVSKSWGNGIEVGDQLISLDGASPLEALSLILCGGAGFLDNKTLAKGCNSLTIRSGDSVPLPKTATAKVVVKRGENLINTTLPWLNIELMYHPQILKSAHDFSPHEWKLHTIGNCNIGYLKIASFDDRALISLIPKVIDEFAETTDALLIDLKNNPGGYEFFCHYTLAWLTPRPLKVAREIFCLNQENDYVQQQALFEETAREMLLYSLEDFYSPRIRINSIRKEVEAWAKGRTAFMTRSDFIIPFKEAYDKPIFVLINNNSASAADLLPAILQDNQRATLIGTTSAGLGGGVDSFQPFLPYLGISEIRLTISLAVREDARTIEDYGVTPDLPMSPTLQERLSPALFVKRVLEEAVIPSLKPANTFRLPKKP